MGAPMGLAAGRSSSGAEIDCPLCDRFELPTGLEVIRTLGPWSTDSLPEALREAHRVPGDAWGQLRVLTGSLSFTFLMESGQPPRELLLQAGEAQSIPPGVPPRRQSPVATFSVELDLLEPPSSPA